MGSYGVEVTTYSSNGKTETRMFYYDNGVLQRVKFHSDVGEVNDTYNYGYLWFPDYKENERLLDGDIYNELREKY